MSILGPPNNICENPSEDTELIIRARNDREGISLSKTGPIKLPGQPRKDPDNDNWTLEEFVANPALLIIFVSNHCPYVEHLRKEILELASYYMEKGLGVLAVSSNYDEPDFIAEEARSFKYPFTHWNDKEQYVAKVLSAVCTPEFFLFKEDDDKELFVLVYHGQFDDSRPCNDVPVTGRDLKIAIECVLNDQPVPSDQKPCVGCSIKWHPEEAVE